MSLIIKGMKMPKRHLFEAFVAIGDGQIVVKDLEKNKLFAGKIEEVRTPHGRLIDADKLVWFIDNHIASGKKWVEFETIKDMINSLPTIIEAEVE